MKLIERGSIVRLVVRIVAGTVGIGVGLVLLLVLLVSGLALIRSPRLRSFEGELPTRSAVQADPRLTLLAQILPPTASDISYYVRPHSIAVNADFTIEQTEFLQWAANQGWKLMKIDYVWCLEPCSLIGEALYVEKGFYYKEERVQKGDPDTIISSLRVFFDTNKSRRFYRFME